MTVSPEPSSSHADALGALAEASDLDALSPEALSVALSEQLPVMAAEFRTITVRITRGPDLDQVLADLERGITLRTFEVADTHGIPRSRCADLLDPADYPLPRRMRNHALFWTSVQMEMPPSAARQMAGDLARGIAARGRSARDIISQARTR